MADNCDSLIRWMDYAARLPVCSRLTLQFEIPDIKYAIKCDRVMSDNMRNMFDSNRKLSCDLRKQILLLARV